MNVKGGNISGRARSIYPRNNTPVGFYSYYDHILYQEAAAENDEYPEISMIDMGEMTDKLRIERNAAFIEKNEAEFDHMLRSAVECLKKVKEERDLPESYYIPNMDFKKTDELRDEIIAKIRKQGL